MIMRGYFLSNTALNVLQLQVFLKGLQMLILNSSNGRKEV